MSDLSYCQYVFALPKCRVQEIGPGVDPHFHVELIREGPIAAVVSRVHLDFFSLERLHGKTAGDLRWLREIADRHNEIICRASSSSAVLPLRLGTVFRSRDSLLAMLVRCRSTVSRFLAQLGNLQEWGVNLYLERRRLTPVPGHNGPPAPHYLRPPRENDPLFGGENPPMLPRRAESLAPSPLATLGTVYLTRKRVQLNLQTDRQASLYPMIQTVERRLAGKAERFCRIPNLTSHMTGRTEEMVFNAAYLLPPSSRTSWLETLQSVYRDIQGKGLLLEVSGPWPPYHFCPSLEF